MGTSKIYFTFIIFGVFSYDLGLSLRVMIGLARYGEQLQGKNYSLSKAIKILFIVSVSTILSGNHYILFSFLTSFRDRIATGSFDKTAKIWDSSSGECLNTLKGHQGEIVCLTFDPHANLLATGSMDNTAKLWDVETGKEYVTLKGHEAEVISLNFSAEGDRIITGSFDATAKIWDIRTG